MLSGVFKCHDIDDVEKFLHWRLGTIPAYRAMSEDNKQDAFCAMLEQVVIYSQQFDPSDGVSFSSKLATRIPSRFIDYLRRYVKDNRYEHERNTEVFATDDHAFFDGIHSDEDDSLDHEYLLEDIAIDQLTECSRMALLEYAIPIRRGAYIKDLADLHDVTVARIRLDLKTLQQELEQTNGTATMLDM